MEQKIRFDLDENELPKKWYNILPDLPRQLPPPLSPVTKEPINPKDLEILFAKELIKQEVSAESEIPIPMEILEKYRKIRPSPLIRALGLEKALKTNCRIYYKFEGERSPTGSHKVNTALAQAYYNAKEGTETLTTETGAGQWGSALAYADQMFGLKTKIMMVKTSYNQKPYRKTIMELFGAEVYSSPSTITDFGREVLKKNPNNPGSLGIAISEAIALAIKDENTKYSLGSVLNHVLIHQSIIGLEAIKQFEKAENIAYPDFIVGCVGGGSNFAGLTYPFIRKTLGNGIDMTAIAAESTAASKMSDGRYRYDFGDTANMTPLLKMYTLGSDFIPAPIHAGGLRYHGAAPSLSLLINTGHIKPVKFDQLTAFKAGEIFAKAEGIIPAPESDHAIAAVIDLVSQIRKQQKTIIFNLSGHGLLDLFGYQQYLRHELS